MLVCPDFQGGSFPCNISSLTDPRNIIDFSLYNYFLLSWEWWLLNSLDTEAEIGNPLITIDKGLTLLLKLFVHFIFVSNVTVTLSVTNFFNLSDKSSYNLIPVYTYLWHFETATSAKFSCYSFPSWQVRMSESCICQEISACTPALLLLPHSCAGALLLFS